MPIKFAVNIVCPTNGLYHIIFSQSDDLDLQSRSQLRLTFDNCFLTNISDNISAMAFKLGMAVDMHGTSIFMHVATTLAFKTFERFVRPAWFKKKKKFFLLCHYFRRLSRNYTSLENFAQDAPRIEIVLRVVALI